MEKNNEVDDTEIPPLLYVDDDMFRSSAFRIFNALYTIINDFSVDVIVKLKEHVDDLGWEYLSDLFNSLFEFKSYSFLDRWLKCLWIRNALSIEMARRVILNVTSGHN
jgi:hypothetical protein